MDIFQELVRAGLGDISTIQANHQKKFWKNVRVKMSSQEDQVKRLSQSLLAYHQKFEKEFIW